jgi:hypothetical protein
MTFERPHLLLGLVAAAIACRFARMPGAGWDVRNWTAQLIAVECRRPYREFHRQLRERHVDYFNARPEQRSLNVKRPFEARELSFAFPRSSL